MRRVISVLLMLSLLLSGCGGEQQKLAAPSEPTEMETTVEPTTASAYDMARGAYTDLCAAYELVSQMGFDLHNVWRVGAYEADKANNGKYVEYMTPHLQYLTKEEFAAGVARTLAWNAGGKKWDTLSVEEKNSYLEYANSEFYIKREHFQYFCMSSILHAYYLKGVPDEIREFQQMAKVQLKDLEATYPEDTHYSILKEFYKTVDAYFELCYSDGDGGAGISFNQYKELRGTYIKEAQAHLSELSFEFED